VSGLVCCIPGWPLKYIELSKTSALAFAVHLARLSNCSQRNVKMKSTCLFAAAALFMIPALAFAGPKHSANVQLDQPVTVAGTQLAPGRYKLLWEGSGSDVTVTFAEGKKTVATAAAKLASNPINQEAIETATAADNTTELRAIDLKNIKIQFQNAAPGAGN
jgi:hypothetical protein